MTVVFYRAVYYHVVFRIITCFNETIIKESKARLNTGNATWLFNYLFMREAETYQLLTVGLLNFLSFGLIETKKNLHKMIIIIELQVSHICEIISRNFSFASILFLYYLGVL